MDVSIYKITEDHPVALSQTKNEHIQLYLVIMKVKKKSFLDEIVNSGYNNKGQVDKFVKCLKSFLVYRTFYKNKPKAARNKGFKTYMDSKPITLKP